MHSPVPTSYLTAPVVSERSSSLYALRDHNNQIDSFRPKSNESHRRCSVYSNRSFSSFSSASGSFVTRDPYPGFPFSSSTYETDGYPNNEENTPSRLLDTRPASGSSSSFNLSETEVKALSDARDKEAGMEGKKLNKKSFGGKVGGAKGKVASREFVSGSESSIGRRGPLGTEVSLLDGSTENDPSLQEKGSSKSDENGDEIYLSPVEVQTMGSAVPLVRETNASQAKESAVECSKTNTGKASIVSSGSRRSWGFRKIRRSNSIEKPQDAQKRIPNTEGVESAASRISDTQTATLKKSPSLMLRLWNSIAPPQTEPEKKAHTFPTARAGKTLGSLGHRISNSNLFQIFVVGNHTNNVKSQPADPIVLDTGIPKDPKIKALDVPDSQRYPLQSYYAPAKLIKQKRESMLHEAAVLSFWGVLKKESILVEGKEVIDGETEGAPKEFEVRDTQIPDMVVGRRWEAKKFGCKEKPMEPRIGQGELKIEEFPVISVSERKRKFYPTLSPGTRSIRRSNSKRPRPNARISWTESIQEYAGGLNNVHHSGERPVSDDYHGGSSEFIRNLRALGGGADGPTTNTNTNTPVEGLEFGRSGLAGDWASAVQMMEEFSGNSWVASSSSDSEAEGSEAEDSSGNIKGEEEDSDLELEEGCIAGSRELEVDVGIGTSMGR